MNYQKIYDALIERGRNRIPQGYVERHHILPRCMGGSDENSNLVALTPEEHFVAHILLVKMYPEHRGLIAAVQGMTQTRQGRPNRKLYGWLKRRHTEYMSDIQSGEGNSQFGTRWIHRGLENKKIKKEDLLPEGWIVGRKMKEKIPDRPKPKKEKNPKPKKVFLPKYDYKKMLQMYETGAPTSLIMQEFGIANRQTIINTLKRYFPERNKFPEKKRRPNTGQW